MLVRTPILEVKQLTQVYSTSRGTIKVLDDFNFSIAPSEFVAVSGASGSGKTTLLLAGGGMLKPTSGNVVLAGHDLFELSPIARSNHRACHLGFLFQTLELVPYLSLLENVRLSRGVTSEIAAEWLEKLGLNDRMHHKPELLSHGQRQRAALARALAHQPSLIIADEPTGNLDEVNSQIVFQTLQEYKEKGGAVLVASHDPQIASWADRVIRLDANKDES